MLSPDFYYWLPEVLLLLGIVTISQIAIWKRRGTAPFLCGDCRFNDPDMCLKTERPYALDCTSYRVARELTSGSHRQ